MFSLPSSRNKSECSFPLFCKELFPKYSIMQSGQAETGMQTMNQSLANLYRSGLITLEDAFRYSPDIKELERMLSAYKGIN